jgi:hypothetical protein
MEKNIDSIFRQYHGRQKYLNYFLSGFADGESSFSVAILRHPIQKFGWMINPVFQVYQHENHRYILEIYRKVFGAGSIYRKSGIHPVLNFSIDSRRNLLEKVIPFFNKYPLIVKAETFIKFKEIVYSMEAKEHWKLEGFKRLVDIAYSMNQQGKGRRHTKEFIFANLGKPQSILEKSSETTR